MTRPRTWGTTARLGTRGLLATLAASGCVLAAVLILALAVTPESLEARLEALRALAIAGPAIVASVAGVATAAVGAHGVRHAGGPPAPTSAEMESAARVEPLP